MATALARQLRLDLKRERARSRARFVVSESNAEAVALLDAPERWLGGVLALVGPSGAGKTHLALDWSDREGALRVDPGDSSAAEAALAEGRPALWDDVDQAERHEETLFHLINIAARGSRLLLTGAMPPRTWPVALPDLRSRLKGLTVATLEAPDDAVMTGVLLNLFAERSITPTPDVLPYLLRRMPRSAPAARTLVERLDAESRPVTRALARAVLGDVDEDGD